MGYDDIIEELHGEFCRFLEGPEGRKQGTLPRSFVKTWIATIAYSIWCALPRTKPDEFPAAAIRSLVPSRQNAELAPPSLPLDTPLPFVPLSGYASEFEVDPFYTIGPNLRILLASYVVGNSMKMISLIRKTYERNKTMMILFPEVIPENFTKVKWSDTEACIARSENFTESTFEAGGIGGSTTSRHYDMIIEDDLIYANKDDFSGRELQPNQEDIDKAIGWHKLAMSLLVPGPHTRIHNIGTRWAKNDLVQYIRDHEPDYIIFERAATKGAVWPEGIPEWPQMYGTKKLQQIFNSQGPYMFSTQYLNRPIAPEDMLFKPEWLQYYKAASDVPTSVRIFTTTDLSTWGASADKHSSRGVVLTCAWDSNNHVWILRYDVGRFNPSQIIDIWYMHNKLYKPELIGVEEVYYQKAVGHFARLRMQKEGWLPVRGLKTSTHVDKDVRIRALEPYAINGAIHCRHDHKDFILEYSDYVPNAKVGTKDILDALAYQLQIARPGIVEQAKPTKEERSSFIFSVKMDDVLESLWSAKRSKGAFKEYAITDDAHLSSTEEEEFSQLVAPLEQ